MRGTWDRLLKHLRDGTLNRRDFLAAAAALGVTATTADKALADTPKRGGHLIVGHAQAGTQDSLDPARWNSAFMQSSGPSFYDTLTVSNEKLEILPQLAESWEAKPGAKEWVFKLRKGVTFHNGKSLTPADVIYSINHHRGPDSKSVAKTLVDGIEDIKATGPNEVTFILSTPNVDFPAMFADGRTGIAPDGSNFTGIGAGPFVLESFEPGIRISGKRNTNDYDQNRGWVASMEYVAINDPTARIAALMSGGVHLINKLTSATADQLKKGGQAQVFDVASSTHCGFAMHCGTAPFNNLDLRLAMKYAMDKPAILKTVFHGYGLIANDQPIPPSYPFYSKTVPTRPYDPDKAKFHFKKSGFSGPVTLTTCDAAFDGSVEAAQIYQANAKKAGIDIQIDRVPNDGYFSKYWGKVPLCGTTWGGKPTSDMLFALEFTGGSPMNESHWNNDKFNQLLTASRAETDKTKRAQMYHDMQQLVSDDGGTIMPVYNSNIDGGSKKLRGFIPSPVQQMSGYRASQMVWLDG